MGCVRAPIPQLKSALVLPFDAEPLRGLDQLQVRVQMTNLVGRLDVSSREIFPLLLVSNSTVRNRDDGVAGRGRLPRLLVPR